MITEERMKALFAQANPIPDGESIELRDIGGKAYLATLEQRSSDMTQTTVRSAESKPNPRAMRWVLGVAALVLIAALGIGLGQLLDNSEGDPPVATTQSLTEDDVVGRWRSEEAAFVQILGDGTYEVQTAGFGSRQTVDVGTWTLEGNIFTWSTDEESPTCGGVVGRYEATLDEDGALVMTVIGEDPCVDRALNFEASSLVPLAN